MRVFVEGYGCSLNKADTEQIRGFLAANGIKTADKPENADFIIINTCAVKRPTETRMLNRIRKMHAIAEKSRGTLIVFGCLPAVNGKAIAAVSPEIAQIGPSLKKLSEFLGLPEQEFCPSAPQARENNLISIIPIARGCLGSCAYCCVRNARGSLKSYPVAELDEKFKKAVSETKEIWLTAQDCGCYGADIGTSLPALLRSLLRNKGDFRVRVGMINPQHLLSFLPEYLELFSDSRLYRFFHLPLQSGSNAVLRAMNRKYSKENFLFLAEKIRGKFPDAAIATDIIVGFPGETEKQFKETLAALRKAKPDIVNISRFGPRPGTAAAVMKCQLHGGELKRRSRIAAALCRRIALQRNLLLVGSVQKIFVDEKGPRGNFVGTTNSYKHVVIKEDFLGKFAAVRVKKAFSTHFEGELPSK